MAQIRIKKTDRSNGQILARETETNKKLFTEAGIYPFFLGASSLLKKQEDKSKLEELIKTKLKLKSANTTPDIASLIYATIKIAFDNDEEGVILHRSRDHVCKDLKKEIINKLEDPTAKTVIQNTYKIIQKMDANEFENAMKKTIQTLKSNKTYKVEKIHSDKNSKTKPSAPPAPEAPKSVLANKTKTEHKKTSDLKVASSNLLDEIRKGKKLKDASKRVLNEKPSKREINDWDDAFREMQQKIPVFKNNDVEDNKGPTEDSEWDD